MLTFSDEKGQICYTTCLYIRSNERLLINLIHRKGIEDGEGLVVGTIKNLITESNSIQKLYALLFQLRAAQSISSENCYLSRVITYFQGSNTTMISRHISFT